METVFFHYLHLPVPSMLFFGITLLLVALLIPDEGLMKSPWIKRLPVLRRTGVGLRSHASGAFIQHFPSEKAG